MENYSCERKASTYRIVLCSVAEGQQSNNMHGLSIMKGKLRGEELPFLTEVINIVFLIMSRIMRLPDFCLCENKAADQHLSNCSGQHL